MRGEDLLRKALEGSVPADPSGAFERVLEKKLRRRSLRKAQMAGLTLVVVVGTALGTYGLSRAFRATGLRSAGGVANGRIAFSDIRMNGFGPDGARVYSDWHLYTMNADGSDVSRIGPDGVDEALYPTWSPDGTQMAFVGFTGNPPQSAVYVANADGSALRIIRPTGADEQIEGLRWSPDGSRIGFELAQPIGTPPQSGYPFLRWTIWTMAPDGSDEHPVTTTGLEMHFSWSPDGSRIVFDRASSITNTSDLADAKSNLFVVDADGSDEVQLTDDGLSLDPAWSPDGNRIAFQHGPRDDRRVAVVSADGGTIRELPTQPVSAGASSIPYGNSVEWSPDGKLVAFSTHASDDVCRISTIDVKDGQIRTLISSPAAEGCPGQEGMSWAPALGSATPSPEVSNSVAPSVTATGTATPEPTETPSAVVTTPPWRDVAADLPGVGAVCGLTSASGDFLGSGVVGTAYVFEPEPEGGCSGGNENFQYLGIATAPGGPVETLSPKLTECGVPEGCWVFSTPDVDGDGRAEVAVATATPPYLFFQIWSLVPCGAAADCKQTTTLEPLSIAHPGDPAEGFPPGPAVFRWGGSPDDAAGVRCDTIAQGKPELIEWFTASSEAHFEIEGTQLILTAEVPWDASNPPSLSDLCGAPVSVPGQ